MKRFGKYADYLIVFFVGTALITVYKTFDNFRVIGDFFNNILSILTPFIIGFILAYFLNTPVKYVSNFFDKSDNRFIKEHKNAIAVAAVYLSAILLIALVLKMILPVLIQNITELCQNIPRYITLLTQNLNNLNFGGVFANIKGIEFLSDFDPSKLLEKFDFSMIGKYAQGIFGITSNVINVFIGIIISIYMLLDKDIILEFVYRVLSAYFDRKTIRKITEKIFQTNSIFSSFINCQLIDALVVAIIASVVLMLMKVKYALVLGCMMGFFNLIPYFGAIFACIVAVTITFFTGGLTQAIWVFAALLITQQVDGNIIGPRIMGNSLNVRPLLIIFAVTFGGGLFGIIGMLLSVPVAALLTLVIDEYLTYREERNKMLFLAQGYVKKKRRIRIKSRFVYAKHKYRFKKFKNFDGFIYILKCFKHKNRK